MPTGTAMVPNTPNFLGILFNSNVRKTQFLSLIGGTDGANALITTNPQFPTGVGYSLTNPEQPAITETAAVGAGTATYFGLSQSTNVIQIFQEDLTVSRLRERASGMLSGVNTAGMVPEENSQIALQIQLHLEKMKRDMNYTAINGVYSEDGLTDATKALKTRGMLSAITTNATTPTVATDAEYVDAVDNLIKSVFDKGAFMTPVLVVNSTEKVKLSKAYHTLNLTEVDADRFTAGVSVDQIVTNFGQNVYVVVDNDMPEKTLMLVDLDYVKPVFTRDVETGEIITIKPHDQRGGNTYELYAEFGLDHGAEINHGKLVYTTA